jgi:hypothetical protein
VEVLPSGTPFVVLSPISAGMWQVTHRFDEAPRRGAWHAKQFCVSAVCLSSSLFRYALSDQPKTVSKMETSQSSADCSNQNDGPDRHVRIKTVQHDDGPSRWPKRWHQVNAYDDCEEYEILGQGVHPLRSSLIRHRGGNKGIYYSRSARADQHNRQIIYSQASLKHRYVTCLTKQE